MLKIVALSQFILFSSLSLFVYAATDPPVCRFGLPPWHKGRDYYNEVRKAYQPMLDWLTERTGCQFISVGSANYDAVVEQLVTGKVQLAELGPVTYVLATQRSPHVRLLLTTLIWNIEKTKLVDSYYGYILTLKSNKEINTIEDLKGKPFGFVNLDSTSGYVYPNALLRKQGINPKTFFGKLHFLGSHPNVTDAIVAQSIVAGATWQPNLINAVKKHGDVFKVVLQTPLIPNMCIVTHPSLPEAIRTKIEQLLPTIDPSLLEGTGWAGFVVRPDSFYEDIRQLVLQDSERN